MDLKLRVNPLPAHLWSKNLRAFMSDGAWKKFRASLIAERGENCSVCGKHPEKPLHAHEDWSLDLNFKPLVARLERVDLICWHCHMCEHFGRLNTLIENGALGPEARADVIRHFCEVNGVGRPAFDIHYKEAMQEWARLSRLAWLVDFGEYRHLLPKAELRSHYDPDGNPIAWLSFDHIEADRLSAFLHDLGELSRFYGVWIGQTNKRSLLPLHMREPGDHRGRYLAETRKPWGLMPATDPRADDYGAFMGWENDPINPKPPYSGVTLADIARQANAARKQPSDAD